MFDKIQDFSDVGLNYPGSRANNYHLSSFFFFIFLLVVSRGIVDSASFCNSFDVRPSRNLDWIPDLLRTARFKFAKKERSNNANHRDVSNNMY